MSNDKIKGHLRKDYAWSGFRRLLQLPRNNDMGKNDASAMGRNRKPDLKSLQKEDVEGFRNDPGRKIREERSYS
jgi:hypothetical protein